MQYIFLGITGLLILGFVYTVISTPRVKTDSESVPMTTQNRPRRASDKVALFAGGCFWSLESSFENIPHGIVDVVSGYAGGMSENPTYENYAEGGHKEVVQVLYDPEKISYGQLTEYFFRHIDPTDAGGSFSDRGAQYTSGVYYANTEEKKAAEDVVRAIDAAKIFEKPIATVILPGYHFWQAEEYHQNYAKNNAVRYAAYRAGSSRDAFLKKTWEGKDKVMYKE